MGVHNKLSEKKKKNNNSTNVAVLGDCGTG